MAKSAKAFRTISEVADWLGTPAHVLRFWESRFDEISPVKRAGGRRYYRPEDMRLLGGIKHLLHVEGLSIKAVQAQLEEDGVAAVAAFSPSLQNTDAAAQAPTGEPAPSNPAARAPTEEGESAADPAAQPSPSLGFYFDDGEDARDRSDGERSHDPAAQGDGAASADAAVTAPDRRHSAAPGEVELSDQSGNKAGAAMQDDDAEPPRLLCVEDTTGDGNGDPIAVSATGLLSARLREYTSVDFPDPETRSSLADLRARLISLSRISG